MLTDPTLYVQTTWYALASVGALLALNFLCWLAARRWPWLLMSEFQRINLDHYNRYKDENDLKPYVLDWFEIQERERDEFVGELKWFIEPSATQAQVYEEFVGNKHPPYSGRYINIDRAGFRRVTNQGPWPPSSQYYNVFMFGGSTTLGVCKDDVTIPSLLQAELNRRRAISRPIRVYHFGRGSYYSTQERILFQQLLIFNAVPDMVVFLDGTNDFYFYDGTSAFTNILRPAVLAHNREYDDENMNRSGARPKWQKLAEFLASLPLVRAISAVGTAIANRGSFAKAYYRPEWFLPEALPHALMRYIENKRQIEALCRDRRIRSVFVWQPIPAYKYNLKYHKALHPAYGLGGHERSGLGYELMAKWLETNNLGDNFVYLADIQENETRSLYVDTVHYTTPFHRVIARLIADAIFDRGFIPGKKRQPEPGAHLAQPGAAE